MATVTLPRGFSISRLFGLKNLLESLSRGGIFFDFQPKVQQLIWKVSTRMLPSGYSSRHNSRQFMEDRASFSSTSSLRSQQTPPEETSRHSTGTASRNATEYESELGHLLSPLSPPPSLDQVLEANNSSSQRPIPTPSPSSSYQGLYDHIERELLEPSSSHQQPDNSRYQSLYDDFAQALSAAPASANSSSRRQSAVNVSTSRVSRGAHSHYPGVNYDSVLGKWRARWTDPAISRRVSLGSYRTQSEAINVLESYKASHSAQTSNCPGVYYSSTGKWTAKYFTKGEQVQVGTFNTQEEAKAALKEHRVARRLPPMRRGHRA